MASDGTDAAVSTFRSTQSYETASRPAYAEANGPFINPPSSMSGWPAYAIWIYEHFMVKFFKRHASGDTNVHTYKVSPEAFEGRLKFIATTRPDWLIRFEWYTPPFARPYVPEKHVVTFGVEEKRAGISTRPNARRTFSVMWVDFTEMNNRLDNPTRYPDYIQYRPKFLYARGRLIDERRQGAARVSLVREETTYDDGTPRSKETWSYQINIDGEVQLMRERIEWSRDGMSENRSMQLTDSGDVDLSNPTWV